MKPENEVPPVNTSNAAGSATLTLRDNTLEYIISYQGLGYDTFSAFLHVFLPTVVRGGLANHHCIYFS